MAHIIVGQRAVREFLGLPEDAIVYDAERISPDLFRFKVTGPITKDEDVDNQKS